MDCKEVVRTTQGNIEWLQFRLLKECPWVTHGVFLRHGGVSEREFSSLNLSDSVGDSKDRVLANRERVAQALGLSSLVFLEQTHGVDIVEINAQNMTQSHQADGVFSKEKNLGLAITHADCQAALFYDTEHQVIAAAHAGVKGSMQNIYKKLITALQDTVKTNPQKLLVCISPSLGPDHAEYHEQHIVDTCAHFMVKSGYFDFWKMSYQQLIELGVLQKNIEIARICTACNEKDYFSYRCSKKTGRNASIIGLTV
jgi:YfiH family protein